MVPYHTINRDTWITVCQHVNGMQWSLGKFQDQYRLRPLITTIFPQLRGTGLLSTHKLLSSTYCNDNHHGSLSSQDPDRRFKIVRTELGRPITLSVHLHSIPCVEYRRQTECMDFGNIFRSRVVMSLFVPLTR
jgi:hypothetical protein